MEANLDETAAAAERSAYGTRRTKAAAVGKQRPAGGSTAAAAAAGTVTDYLTSSLGRYKGGAPGGALPVDRFRGHRLRCKAVLRSNMPNDKGREVRVLCVGASFATSDVGFHSSCIPLVSSGHPINNCLMRSWLTPRRAPNPRRNSQLPPLIPALVPASRTFYNSPIILATVCDHVRPCLGHLDGVRAAAAQLRAPWGAIPSKGQTPKTWRKQQVRRNRTEPPRYMQGPSAKRYPPAPALAKKKRGNWSDNILCSPGVVVIIVVVGYVRYYVPQDLYLGAIVPLVTGHTLVVTEMDRSSLALCEAHPQEFPLMNCTRVLGRVAQRARNMRLDLRR